MSQIQLIEVLCFFKKKGNTWILSNWINKDWFPDGSESGPFQLGRHRIEADQLNHLRITFEDETKLQCVLFYKEDEHNWPYGTREYVRNQLKQLTGCPVRMARIKGRGRSKPDLLYIPLRHSRDYELFFSQYDPLREFRSGSTIAEWTFQNRVPNELPTRADTLIITDSYLEDLGFLKQFGKLKSLIIERCVVKDWDCLRNMTNLENLHIETADIQDSSIVQNLSELRRLSLVDCDLDEVAGLSGTPALEFCDLSDNRNLNSVDALNPSKGLKWLIAENADIRTLDLIHWPELAVLEISFNCMEALKNLRHCQDLKLLDFSFNWFEEPTMLGILQLVRKNKLIAFDLCSDFYLTEGLN